MLVTMSRRVESGMGRGRHRHVAFDLSCDNKGFSHDEHIMRGALIFAVLREMDGGE